MEQNRIEVYFKGISDEMQDILVAELSSLGCDTFWNSGKGLRAYFEKDQFPADAIEEILIKYELSAPRVQSTASEEWSVALKDQYAELIIDDQLIIDDGKGMPSYEFSYRIIVDPKLAFGSGHHPTTFLCLERMLFMDFTEKTVLDLGCGSGILSVLAHQKGAKEICAIDNNPWAIEISEKTFNANQCKSILLKQSEIADLENETFEVVLANLNASVIGDELSNITEHIAPNGKILLSGFMEKDQEQIVQQCEGNGITLAETNSKDGWVVLVGIKL